MNPYIIERQPQPNLIDAFMRGREQVENMRANRQTRELNDLRLQSERDRIDQEKISREQDKKLKQAFGVLLQKHQGNADLAQREVNQTAPPEYALPLNEMFARYRATQVDPVKRDQARVDLQAAKTEEFLPRFKPMVDRLVSMTPEQQQQNWPAFVRSVESIGSGLPDYMLEQGLTPEALEELQMVASGANVNQKNFLTFEQRKELEQLQQGAMNERAQMSVDARLKGLDIAEEGNVIKREGLGIRRDKQDRDFKIQDVEMGTKIETINDNLDSFDELYKTTSDIYNNRDLWANAGLGKIGAKIPGTVAADIKSNLQYVVDNLVIPTFANAKAQGVTFGAASEKEWEMIKNGVANLDPNQSPESYRANVFRIMKKIERFKSGAQRESDKYRKILDKGPSEKSEKTIQMVRDPKTGKLVRK